MTIPGTPVGGFQTVGQIDGTNNLTFHAKQSGLAIAIELLSSHASGAPIVDDTGKFIGFVSEFDLLGSIESAHDLNKVTADQIMSKDHFVADQSTTVSDAIFTRLTLTQLHPVVAAPAGVTTGKARRIAPASGRSWRPPRQGSAPRRRHSAAAGSC